MLVLFALVLFSAYWVKQDHFVYFWDYSNYWCISIERMEYMFNHSFEDILKSLLFSINNDDYNNLLPTILALPLKMVGDSFARYAFLNVLIFLIPSILVQGLIAVKVVDNFERKSMVYILALIIAALMPANYYATFRGYIDVAFLLPTSIALYLFVDFDFRQIIISKNVAISLMLVLGWLCRRYVIFFIIGYVLALTVKAIIIIIEDRGLKNLGKIFLNFFIIGGTSIGILLLFFRQFFLHALLTDYGNMYSAYDAPFSIKIQTLETTFGIVSLVIILMVGVLCIINKSNCVNYFSLLIMLITECFVFWRTQSMSIQHRMILNVPIFIIFAVGLNFWKHKKTNSYFKNCVNKIICIFCATLMVLNFCKAFIPLISVSNTGTFYSERYYPLFRNDMNALNEIVDKLNDLTDGTEDKIYVLASGTTLNSDVLRKFYMPYSNNAVINMCNTHDVDLRDGFPEDFLHARYVVTTDPVQLHLPSGQEVVSYLANNVNDADSYIGCHYKRMWKTELDNNVTVYLFEKESDYTEEDLQQISKYYSNLYPGYDSIFAEKIKLN